MKKKIVPWLFVLPGIIFTIWWRYYPISRAIYMSFFDYDVVNPPGKFVGFENYFKIFKLDFYWNAWWNTLWFFVLSVGFTFIIPIIQAIFLSEIKKGRKFYTLIYLIPAMIPVSVNVILWKWIWHPSFGIANKIVGFLGLDPQLWLSDPEWVKFCIVFPGVLGGGIVVLLYLAAILGIPEEIYESAEIDGCTGWKKVFYIVLPNIKFLISIQLLIMLITVIQLLDAPFQYTGGGPVGASTTMGIFIRDMAYEQLSFGRANAASVVLFLVIATFSIVQIKLSKSED